MKKLIFSIIFCLFTENVYADLESAKDAYRTRNYATALSEFLAYSERGYAEADFMLSMMYINGEGVPKDLNLAIQYAQKAIEGNNKGAFALIASIYLSKQSDIRDISKAIEWYEKGIQAKDINSMRHLGLMYLSGVEVKQDYQRAYSLLKDAADRDDVLSMYELGLMFEFGNGVKQDEAKALRWYKSMLSAPPGLIRMSQPKPRFRIAHIKEKNPRSDNDLYQALKYFEQAAIDGLSEAMNRAGLMYQHGRGAERDYRKAAIFFERAADQGNANGTFNGGVLFELGLGVPQSYAEAMTWFKAAANLQNTAAMRRLAQYYDDGISVSIDHKLAQNWYCKSSMLDLEKVFGYSNDRESVSRLDDEQLITQLAILSTCGKHESINRKRMNSLQENASKQLKSDGLEKLTNLSDQLKNSLNFTTVLKTLTNIDPK